MKILYLNPSGQLGGAEVCLLNMMVSILATEPDWYLHLIVSEEGPLISKARSLGVQVTILPFPQGLSRLGDAGAGGPAGDQISRFTLLSRMFLVLPSVARYMRRLRQVIKSLSPDIVHTNGFKMHALAAMVRPNGTPLIWHLHDYVGARPVMARLLRRLASRCTLAIAITQSVAEDARKVFGEHLPIKTVYNKIDLTKFSPDGPKLNLDMLAGLPPVEPNTVLVGMLATMARWKGHEVFLRAMAMLPNSVQVRGYLIGGSLYKTSGSEYSLVELKALADNLGLSKRIGFTGFVDNPAAAMRALDVVVHASTQPEPFGLVIAEGMACGRAVISSEGGGASELIHADFNALGHQPGDAARLAERIRLLATDGNLRARLGAAGRLTAEQRFDRMRLAKELIPIYQSVLPSKV